MVKNAAEIMQSLRDVIGDKTDDATITLLEDVQDTLNAGAEEVSWKQKYEDNDAAWRKKYRDRFTNADSQPNDHEKGEEEDQEVPLTFDKLFKEE